MIMKLNEAILCRIYEICKEQNSNICEICLKGGMSPSSIYDLAKGRTKCSKVITVKCFCEGAGITLSEFFNKDYFNEAEDDRFFVYFILYIVIWAVVVRKLRTTTARIK